MGMKEFMARGERGNEAAGEVQAPRPLSPAAPAIRTVAPSTSVDSTSEVEGRLRCKETLRIDGRVQGEVHCERAVLIGEGARVKANITADEVQISGHVEGDIAARRKITLERTAVVTGDLTTPGIVIEEGAKLKGRIVIGSEEEPAVETESASDAKKSPAPSKPRTAASKSEPSPSPELAASA
jgi:cytoskeletal protein CcmA (bactofilin family)